MKIKNKKQLKDLLVDSYIDEDRAEVLANATYILTPENYDKLFNELEEKVNEYGEENFTFTWDENIESITEYLDQVPNEAISNNFGNIYSGNELVCDENGRGLLFIEALWR